MASGGGVPSWPGGSVRRLSGQHIPPPRGVPIAPPSMPRGPPPQPLGPPSRSGPPPLHDNVSLMARAPSFRSKATEDWSRQEAVSSKSLLVAAEAAQPHPAREVNSRSDVKGIPSGASMPVGVAVRPLPSPYMAPPSGPALLQVVGGGAPPPVVAAPPLHYLPHGAGRLVIRRLDPNAPLPPRPKGPPPPFATVRPMMVARPPRHPSMVFPQSAAQAFMPHNIPPPISFQDYKRQQASTHHPQHNQQQQANHPFESSHKGGGIGGGMEGEEEDRSWAGPSEGKGEGGEEEEEEEEEDYGNRPPSIWSEYWDEEVDASYYYNKQTGEATWIKPADFDGEADFVISEEQGLDSSGQG